MDLRRSATPPTDPPLNLPKPRKSLLSRDDLGQREKGGRQSGARLKAEKTEHGLDSASPAPYASDYPFLSTMPATTPHTRRNRPETSHQKAVTHNRRMRIEKILHENLRREQQDAMNQNEASTSTFIYRAMNRISDLPNGYDTDDEDSWGPGGLLPNPGRQEREDFGGEALRYKKVYDRAVRRLDRLDSRGLNGVNGATQRNQGPHGIKRRHDIYDRCDDGEREAAPASLERAKNSVRRPISFDPPNGVHHRRPEEADGEAVRDDRAEEESNEESGSNGSSDNDDDTDEEVPGP